MTPRAFDAICRRWEDRRDWEAVLAAMAPHAISSALGGDAGLEEFVLTRARGARRRKEEARLAAAFDLRLD
jgi:hypothetical protein